jgi:hypothetical protein
VTVSPSLSCSDGNAASVAADGACHSFSIVDYMGNDIAHAYEYTGEPTGMSCTATAPAAATISYTTPQTFCCPE